MKMKKVSAIVIAICLSVSVLTGCGGEKPSEQTSGNSTSGSTSVSSSQIPNDQVVELTAIFPKHPLTKPLAEMEWLQEAEKRAGVHVQWEEITADWAQKKSTLFASGDIPDLVVGANSILDTDFAQFPGLFEDLTPLIDKYAPNVKKMFEEKPETKVIATQLDGKIYGLPKYQRYWPVAMTRQFINKQWLDNLGLQVPANWDELYNVLVDFKEKDANGNGDPNDEIPMDFGPLFQAASFGAFQPTVLLGSIGITLTDNSPLGYFVEDGKVKNYLIDERYKTMVNFLNKCYTAGLINTEVFTQDYTKYQSIARGDGKNAKVGYTYGWDVTDRFGNTLSTQYISMGPLKQSAGSTVKLSWDYAYNTLNYATNCIQIASACDNKEAAIRFINEFYDPKVSMQVLFGSIGPNISDNGDETYTVLPPKDPSMDPGTWKWTSTFADFGPMYISDSLKLTLGTDMQAIGEQTKPLEDVLNSIDKNKNVLPTMFMKLTTEDNSALGLNNTNVMNFALPAFSQAVIKGGFNNNWDEYVKNCEKAGITKNIEIYQKYYDDYISKNK